MSSVPSKSFTPSPTKAKGASIMGRNRARSPSEASSVDNGADIGGVRLDALSLSDSPPTRYTPPHSRLGLGNSHFAKSVRNDSTDSLTYAAPAASDDVFLSPAKTIQERRQERSVTTPNPNPVRLDVALANGESGLRHQSSNLAARHQINGVDAQNLYPPTACVFVANLPEPKDDTALEAALYREFLKYGKCWVKIRRDGHHMPFAFVQFTSDEEAKIGLEQGKGAIIFGRPCRTEMVKANRTFIVQKKQGAPITVDEAQDLLLPYGSLSKCELLHPQLREPLGFGATVLVEFSMFDATRDLHTAFRQHAVYSITAFDLKKNCAATRNSVDEAFLATCERDRRSVFVGDLPASTMQEDIEEMFSEVGEVLKVNLIQKQHHPSTVRTMAFIEYSQPDMPEMAIARFHGSNYKGAILRVERKTIKERGPTPRHSRSQLVLAQQPFEGTAAAQGPGSPEPQVVVTPARATRRAQAPIVSSPNVSSPAYSNPSYNWNYAAGQPMHPSTPYVPNHAASYGGHAGAQGVPMTPQGTPNMVSPYSYYSYWPSMSYMPDPMNPTMPTMPYVGYYQPYASPTPMMGGRSGEEVPGHGTPTKSGHSNVGPFTNGEEHQSQA